MATQYEETDPYAAEDARTDLGYAPVTARQPVSWSPPPSSRRPKVPAKVAEVLGELGLRYKPERSEDQPDAKAALQLLMEDLSDVPADILAVACREISRTHPKHFGLPGASQIIAACKAELDRREGGEAKPKSASVSREEAYRQINRDYAAKGSNFRMAMDGSLFRIGDPGEKRTTNYNGEVVFA